MVVMDDAWSLVFTILKARQIYLGAFVAFDFLGRAIGPDGCDDPVAREFSVVHGCLGGLFGEEKTKFVGI